MFRRIPNSNILILVAVILTIVAWFGAALPKQQRLTVDFIDVGQGDCAVIRTPRGKTIIIDGGGLTNKGDDIARFTLVPFLKRRGINSIDAVMVSHPHEDHIAGLTSVVSKFRVKTVLDSGISGSSPLYARFLREIHKRKIPFKTIRRDNTVEIEPGVRIQILNPPVDESDDTEMNDCSVAARLTYGRISFIFAGDCQEASEADICDSYADLRSTVLKVGHHGSSKSSSVRWLQNVSPSIAVISVGRNNFFHHPSPTALKRLSDIGARIYRTDQDGTVEVATDGRTASVMTYRHRNLQSR